MSRKMEAGLPARLAALGRWPRLALAFIAGCVMTAGHAPVNLPWGWFVAVPLLVLLCQTSTSGRGVFAIGWVAGFGYFVSGLHWVGNAFLVEPDRFALLLPLGVAAMPAGLALFWGAAFWLTHRVRWTSGPGAAGLGAVVALAATLTLVEVARSHVLTGFPWGLPGYIWVETPLMQMAAWAGPFGMTLLTLLITGLPGVALATGARGRWLVTGGCLVLFGAALMAGIARVPVSPAYPETATVLRVVQPNAPQHQKWVPGHRERFYDRAKEATAAEADPALGAPDLIIWPETALFFLPASNPEELVRLSRLTGGAPLVTGALHVEIRDGAEVWYNALFSILPDGQLGPRYDKHHLVPFGEYLPMSGLLTFLGLEKFGTGGGFAEGAGPQTVTLDGVPPFAPLICYEAIFPDGIIGATRPDWLLQVTNDAWFGNFAGPQQHLAQARVRAIEQGLPLVRAANTGISAVIDPHGRVVQALGMGVAGHLDAALPAPLGPTLYARTGDWPAYLAILLLLGLVAVISRTRTLA